MIWLFVLAAALAVGLSQAGDAPPVPDAPPRCSELVIDAGFIAARRAAMEAAFADLRSHPNDNAVEALIRAMQTIAPECDWTPSTTTEIVAGGERVRFDDVIRKYQGLTVRDAEALATGLDPGLEGASSSGQTLLEIVLRIPPVVVEPPRPETPPKPPGGPEGAGAPMPAACTRTRADGDATVCLRRLPTGKWSWTWTPKSGEQLEGVAASSADAVILAYQAAATIPVEYVVAEPVSRSGVKLLRDGTIEVVDPSTWGLAVYKRLREQWTQGERDPMGLVLAALQLTFPAANWFRLKPPGGLDQTAQRVELVAQQQADAPDVVDRIARAMLGAPYDAQHHVFRGRKVDIKPSSQGWYSYRIDGGPWVGAYKTQDQAIAAAHGT